MSNWFYLLVSCVIIGIVLWFTVIPTQTVLDLLLSDVTRVRIINSGVEDGKPCGHHVIFDTSDPEDIAQLKNLLRFNKFESQCMCAGTPVLEFLTNDHVKLSLGIQHGKAIRLSPWLSDAVLARPNDFQDWLLSHGSEYAVIEKLDFNSKKSTKLCKRTEPRHAKSPNDNYLEAEQARLHELVATMPPSIRKFIGPLHLSHVGGGISYNIDDMSENLKPLWPWQQVDGAIAALTVEYPEKSEQIRSLLRWCGKVHNPGNADYQLFPIQMLLHYEPEEVLSVVTSNAKSLDSDEWIGFMRLYLSNQIFPEYAHYPPIVSNIRRYPPLSLDLRHRLVDALHASKRNDPDIGMFMDAVVLRQ